MKALSSIYELLGKLDWDGGLPEALEYPIRIDDYDLPESVKEAWEQMMELRDDFMKEVHYVDLVLRNFCVEYDNKENY